MNNDYAHREQNYDQSPYYSETDGLREGYGMATGSHGNFQDQRFTYIYVHLNTYRTLETFIRIKT